MGSAYVGPRGGVAINAHPNASNAIGDRNNRGIPVSPALFDWSHERKSWARPTILTAMIVSPNGIIVKQDSRGVRARYDSTQSNAKDSRRGAGPVREMFFVPPTFAAQLIG